MKLFKKFLRDTAEILLAGNFMLSAAIIGTIVLSDTLKALMESNAEEWIITAGSLSVAVSVILVVTAIALHPKEIFEVFSFKSLIKKEKKTDE